MRDRQILAYDQLESVWPAFGSVLVDDKLSDGVPTVYVAAGRSAHIDGGIRLCSLDVRTGEMLHSADINMRPEARGENIIRARVLPDILSLQKGAVWMRGLGVDRNLARIEGKPHLYAPRGFLDDTWWHRTYWVYDRAVKGGYFGWPVASREAPSGRLLVTDGQERIYGYGRLRNRPSSFGHPEAGHIISDPTREYQLFAEALGPGPGEAAEPKAKRHITWTARLPFVARSMVLTRDALLVAGGDSLTESAERHGPGTFWVASLESGSKMAACLLPAPPVLDGMAFTDAGIFVSTVDGSLIRLDDPE